MEEFTHEEEGVSQVSVGKDRPANITTSTLAACHDSSQSNGEDDTDEFVARISDQIQPLRLIRDVQEVGTELEKQKFDDDNGKGIGSGHAEQLWSEGALQTGEQGGQENVGNKGHDWNVHVGTVDILTGRQEHRTRLTAVGHGLLLARPGTMAPGEEDYKELVDDIFVRDVEVVLHGRDIDIAVELHECQWEILLT